MITYLMHSAGLITRLRYPVLPDGCCFQEAAEGHVMYWPIRSNENYLN